MTTAEAIANAVVDRLTVPPMARLPATSVRRDPVDPTDRRLLPVLVVEPGDETAPKESTIGRVHRSLTISLTVMAAGDGAVGVADSIVEEAHQRLMSDVSFGGLAFDVREAQTLRRRDELDVAVFAVSKLYQVQYETDRELL